MPFGQATGDTCGCRALPGRDDDAHAIVAAASHGAAAGIHHEADQEPARWKKSDVRGGKDTDRGKRKDRSHTTDTSEEDDSHAVIIVHPNKVRKREEVTKIEREREQET